MPQLQTTDILYLLDILLNWALNYKAAGLSTTPQRFFLFSGVVALHNYNNNNNNDNNNNK